MNAWFSRYRKFRASAGAARLSGAAAMACALSLLGQKRDQSDPRGGVSLNTLKISAPHNRLWLRISHPPIEARIRALQALKRAHSSEGGLP